MGVEQVQGHPCPMDYVANVATRNIEHLGLTTLWADTRSLEINAIVGMDKEKPNMEAILYNYWVGHTCPFLVPC